MTHRMGFALTGFALMSFALLVLAALALPARAATNPATAGTRWYGINFSAPLHQTGQLPSVGNGTIMPTAVTGSPRVTSATPVLRNQPLVLNTELGNGPCCYREAMQLNFPPGSAPVRIHFDLVTEKLRGSSNRFQLLLNDVAVPLLSFSGDGFLLLNGDGAIATFGDDRLLHVQLRLDPVQQQLGITVNGEPVFQGFAPLPSSLQILHFVMSAAEGVSPDQIDPEPYAAIDNIVMGDDDYRYANLQTRISAGAQRGKWQQGHLDYVIQLANISDYTAKDVVLTHFLPPSVQVESVSSEQLNCFAEASRLLCNSAELGAMEHAAVLVRVRGETSQAVLALTAIATSATDEIDNTDNRATAHFGGSAGIWILTGLFALWGLRRNTANSIRQDS